ncbi:phosphoadenylyl-sulfate reductase [Algirhabdus cladophorae]|uniref:phosphoadenylyl-sulfate reductase n=1 Tax=Algirhabdus cladophorae TaxID=3377108 RepID=UPI003B84AA36
MPLEAPLPPAKARAAALNARYKHHGAIHVVEHALSDAEVGRIALVSSFGAESVALLHMVARMDRSTPVIFLDTEMLFPETLTYQAEVADRLGLNDVRVVSAQRDALFERDNENLLHLHDPDACCTLRKTEPLDTALTPFDAWFTGRKRFQSGSRVAMDFFEVGDQGRIKVNPLAHWAPRDVQEYMDENRLPRHPLVAKGYPSLGCAPCTSPVGFGEHPRSGRWREQDKTECGIHFDRNKMVRRGA